MCVNTINRDFGEVFPLKWICFAYSLDMHLTLHRRRRSNPPPLSLSLVSKIVASFYDSYFSFRFFFVFFNISCLYFTQKIVHSLDHNNCSWPPRYSTEVSIINPPFTPRNGFTWYCWWACVEEYNLVIAFIYNVKYWYYIPSLLPWLE